MCAGSAVALFAVWASAEMFQKPATAISATASTMRLGASDRGSEERDRDRSELQPLDVRAEIARNTKATRIAARKTANRPRSRRARGTRAVTRIPSTANATPGTKSATRERELALAREDPAQQQLDRARRGDDDDGRTPRPALERTARQDQRQQQERERAREQRQEDEPGEDARPALLQRAHREQRERRAEGERERGGESDAGPEDGEGAARETRRLPPLLPDDERERQRRGADRRDRQHLDPDHGGKRVVEEAVRDERVAAAVPEVVPEGEAVLEQEGPLVGVRREVDAREARAKR